MLPIIYFSGLETKKKNINYRKSRYCFSKYSPLRSIHICMRLNQFSKYFCRSDWSIFKTWILNVSSPSSGVVKRWLLILFFTYGNKKKSFGAKLGLYGGWLIKSMLWVLKNSAVWADVWELALLWRRVNRLRQLFFLISWKTTNKQIFVYHSELTVLRSSGTIATSPVLPKKQAIICLEVLRARTTLVRSS